MNNMKMQQIFLCRFRFCNFNAFISFNSVSESLGFSMSIKYCHLQTDNFYFYIWMTFISIFCIDCGPTSTQLRLSVVFKLYGSTIQDSGQELGFWNLLSTFQKGQIDLNQVYDHRKITKINVLLFLHLWGGQFNGTTSQRC